MLKSFFISEKKIVDFYRDYSFLLSEAKYKAKHGEGLKILPLQQILQRLSIALVQVKAANTSENLLNEIANYIFSVSIKRND